MFYIGVLSNLGPAPPRIGRCVADLGLVRFCRPVSKPILRDIDCPLGFGSVLAGVGLVLGRFLAGLAADSVGLTVHLASRCGLR